MSPPRIWYVTGSIWYVTCTISYTGGRRDQGCTTTKSRCASSLQRSKQGGSCQIGNIWHAGGTIWYRRGLMCYARGCTLLCQRLDAAGAEAAVARRQQEPKALRCHPRQYTSATSPKARKERTGGRWRGSSLQLYKSTHGQSGTDLGGAEAVRQQQVHDMPALEGSWRPSSSEPPTRL